MSALRPLSFEVTYVVLCPFQKLVHSDTDRRNNWSMSELMHIVVLLAHFHSLSSFVFGCGVNSEIDYPDGHCYVEDGNNEDQDQCNGQLVDDESEYSTEVSLLSRVSTELLSIHCVMFDNY